MLDNDSCTSKPSKPVLRNRTVPPLNNQYVDFSEASKTMYPFKLSKVSHFRFDGDGVITKNIPHYL